MIEVMSLVALEYRVQSIFAHGSRASDAVRYAREALGLTLGDEHWDLAWCDGVEDLQDAETFADKSNGSRVLFIRDGSGMYDFLFRKWRRDEELTATLQKHPGCERSEAWIRLGAA